MDWWISDILKEAARKIRTLCNKLYPITHLLTYYTSTRTSSLIEQVDGCFIALSPFYAPKMKFIGSIANSTRSTFHYNPSGAYNLLREKWWQSSSPDPLPIPPPSISPPLPPSLSSSLPQVQCSLGAPVSIQQSSHIPSRWTKSQ